ncbi:MAG: ChaN family lipoprotein [Desulfobacterales bacterium]
MTDRRRFRPLPTAVACLIAFIIPMTGCAVAPRHAVLKSPDRRIPVETIIAGRTGEPVTFQELLSDLETVPIVYIGEEHPNRAHHEIQVKLIEALDQRLSNLTVGMEMFDYRYDLVLDQWSGGELDRDAFIRQTHWYANWRWDYDLYAGVLDLIRERNIRLVGLNLPFHIPGRIRIGGIEALLEDDRRYLPQAVDLNRKAHREYVEAVFRRHPPMNSENDFERFYQAQCVWEDTMAESVAGKRGNGPMVVIAGNGHIIKKFGIPDRAYERSGTPFRTIYLAKAGQVIELDYGDYLWVTP